MTAPIRPICSARWMKSSGGIEPYRGCAQRTSVSTETMSEVWASMIGWKTTLIWPVGHGLLELGAQLQAAQALLVEDRVVAGDAAGVGGGEQGDVGALHERAGVRAVHRRGGDADGQRDLEVQPGDAGAGRGRLPQAAGGALGGGQGQAGQQDGELLALHARQRAPAGARARAAARR